MGKTLIGGFSDANGFSRDFQKEIEGGIERFLLPSRSNANERALIQLTKTMYTIAVTSVEFRRCDLTST